MTTSHEKKSSIEESAEKKTSNEDEERTTEDTARVFLLAITGFCGTLGIILFITGCVITSQYNLLLDFITGKYTESSIFLILLGLIVTTVSAIGFYASLKSHYVLMTTFLTLMIICVVCEVIGSITMFALNQDGHQQAALRARLLATLAEYGGEADTVTRSWDMVQTDLGCCGVAGPGDYQPTPFFQQVSHLPASCCGPLEVDVTGNAEKCTSATRSAHTSGCYEAMGGYLRGKMGALGGVAAVVAVLQISLISAATVLIKKWSRPSHCYPCY